jgi:phytoene dehydrogenase-like protein
MRADALVVGSGPNGLAAAITLAEAGWRVLVLEAARAPGGAVATEELTLPGFRHDTYSSVYPAAAASPVFARMPLRRHGLEWVHPQVC